MNLAISRAEGATDEVGIPDGDIEEVFLARGTIMGNGALNEVARVIKLMRVYLLPLVSAPPATQTLTSIRDTSSKIAIRLLGLGNDANNRVEVMVEPLIVVNGE